MKHSKKFTVLYLFILLLAFACGGSSSDENNKKGDNNDNNNSSTIDLATCDLPDSATMDAPSGDTVTVKGVVVDSLSVDKKLADIYVHVVDNDTGTPFKGLCTRTAQDGSFELTGVPKGVYIGFVTAGANRKDTYTFNRLMDSDRDDDVIRSVSEDTYMLIPGLLGVTQSDDKGIVAGGVYDATTGDGVADAVVETDKGDKAYYFGDAGTPVKNRDATNTDGSFVFLNVDPGKITITAKDSSGNVLGQTEVLVIKGAISLTSVIYIPQ